VASCIQWAIHCAPNRGLQLAGYNPFGQALVLWTFWLAVRSHMRSLLLSSGILFCGFWILGECLKDCERLVLVQLASQYLRTLIQDLRSLQSDGSET